MTSETQSAPGLPSAGERTIPHRQQVTSAKMEKTIVVEVA